MQHAPFPINVTAVTGGGGEGTVATFTTHTHTYTPSSKYGVKVLEQDIPSTRHTLTHTKSKLQSLTRVVVVERWAEGVSLPATVHHTVRAPS